MTQDARIDLTPDRTHFRVSLAKGAGMVAAIVTATWAVFAVLGELHSHTGNIAVHLPADFRETHGSPLGYWDMKVRDDAAAAGLKALQDQVKALQDWQAKQEAAAEARRPRYRP